MTSFVAYYRVNTAKQGQCGLGLEAQRTMVQAFVKDGALLGEFTEVESGKISDRPELHKAIQLAKRKGAMLVIAKLDRLSRNVSFIASLMDAGVEFVATDHPQTNKFTVHIFAALTEQDRDTISDRTRKALQILKSSGKKLGSPENLTEEARKKGLETRKTNALNNDANRKVTALIVAKNAQNASFSQIAAELNELGFTTRRGAAFTHK
ncbi:recombinase family protein [Solirubrum puertoriconensis]|uniref:Resolvase/invertase-type recombinase catalytic domain-containing protein n=1 Tax=Solirubrum puertoriconensis TaxID=1751427 RepID=A0A9X0HI95_SOLP1|nr:recombinase family protein [Solirubrum puertoriconensis]KUG06369.1 hypothetical protein ASU33_03155 [Solirubrum puertoriconensis]